MSFARGLQIIEENFRIGKSNKAHQSKTTDITDYNDLLFNDWAIHHFHLSDEYEGDFCKRTGPILFALFHGDVVYFLDILEHGRGKSDVWADEHLVAVVDRNWPEFSEQFHIKGAIDLQHQYSASERIKLRRAGVASLLKVDGKVFAPFGLGLNSAGGSTRFSLKAMKILRHLNQAVADLKTTGNFTYPDGSRLSEGVPKNVKLGTAAAILRVRFRDGRFEFYEEKSDQVVLRSAKIVG